MAYDDLRGWIKALDKAGELKHIHEPVDPILEIAEITDRVSKTKSTPGGPALLFENVKGYPGGSVLMNQFGSERRMKLALNVDSLDDVAGRIENLLAIKRPEGPQDGTIIRIQERAGKATQASLKSSALGLDHTVDLNPWQLKTLLVKAAKGHRAQLQEVSLLES